MDYDPYNPLPRLINNEDQELKRLFNAQSSQMAAENYDKVHNSNKLRKWASLVIYKYSKCEYFDATIPYIAMTYFDRYISRGNPILQVMNDIIRDIELLALCCLTLAWKMRDINFTIPKLQQRQPDLAGLTTMEFHRVELKILKALDWNLRVVTAFCFVPYFIPKCVTPHGFNLRSINEIIVGIQCHEDVGIAVAKNKPSVIAASALVAATKLLYHRGLCKSIEEEILQEAHEKRFERKVFSACDAMKLAVESDIIIVHRIGSGPPKRIRVRAGGLLARHKLVGAGNSSERLDLVPTWSPAMGRNDVFVIFGGGTRMAWPHGQDAEKQTRQRVRVALESAVRDLYVERLRLLLAGIFA